MPLAEAADLYRSRQGVFS
ncbi:uncharacterized protein FFB20_15888 [Fusarium fujikuroi]|nr:uncharacterized protein FFB20_15888 [Fusarium fujikuroi]